LKVPKWKDPDPRLFSDLMSLTLHESADLLQITLEPQPDGHVGVKSSRDISSEHLQPVADLSTAYLSEATTALSQISVADHR
jgi:hypothetical protein